MAGVTDKPDSPEAVLRMLFAYAGDSFEDRLRQELAKQAFVGGKRVVKQKVPGLAKQAETTVHVVKVNLHGAKPPVWRRLEIPSVMTLDLVHQVLQAAFGWHDYHLHSFETVCGEFGDPSQDYDLLHRGARRDASRRQRRDLGVQRRARTRWCTGRRLRPRWPGQGADRPGGRDHASLVAAWQQLSSSPYLPE
jgi:hypothetical protein